MWPVAKLQGSRCGMCGHRPSLSRRVHRSRDATRKNWSSVPASASPALFLDFCFPKSKCGEGQRNMRPNMHCKCPTNLVGLQPDLPVWGQPWAQETQLPGCGLFLRSSHFWELGFPSLLLPSGWPGSSVAPSCKTWYPKMGHSKSFTCILSCSPPRPLGHHQASWSQEPSLCFCPCCSFWENRKPAFFVTTPQLQPFSDVFHGAWNGSWVPSKWQRPLWGIEE